MALDTVRLLDSDLFLLASGDEFKAALALWCKSWSQIPAGSLPNDERLLAGLSCAKNWKKVRDMAMRGWILCSDGRWYHPVVSEKALEALPARKAHAENKAAAAERKEREREDRKRLFELLRKHGITPEYHTKTGELRKIAEPYLSQEKSQHVTGDSALTVTAITGQDSRGEERTGEDSTLSIYSVTSVTGGGPPPGHPAAADPPKAGSDGAAKPPKTPEDMQKFELWNAGKSVLETAGMNRNQCGTFIGMLAKDYGTAIALEAVRKAVLEQPADPASFLKATCQHIKGERKSAPKPTVYDQGMANAEEAKALLFGTASHAG